MCSISLMINTFYGFITLCFKYISKYIKLILYYLLQSTNTYDSKDKIMLALEKHGGICDCQASRDTFVYAASAERRGLDIVTQVLGDIVLRPKITEEEVCNNV